MLNIDYESIHPSLRNLVKEYDDWAYQLLSNLYYTRDTYKSKITIDPYDEAVRISYDGILISFFIKYNLNFCIKVFVNERHFDDNMPLLIIHEVNSTNQELLIEEQFYKRGYYGRITNLNELSDIFGKKDDEELKIIKSKLEKMNNFIIKYNDSKDFNSSFKEDNNDIKKLVYIKNLLN